MQPQRQSSSVHGHRELKRSLVGDNTAPTGDKENQGNMMDYNESRRSIGDSRSISVIEQEKRLSIIEQEKRAELSEKDQLHEKEMREMKRQMDEKDVQLRDMERLNHEKDVQLQEIREMELREIELQRLLREKDSRFNDLQSRLTEMEGAAREKDRSMQQLRDERSLQKDDRAERAVQQQLKDEIQQRDGTIQQLSVTVQQLQAELSKAERQAERQANAKAPEEKDFRSLRTKVQEQKTLIESLESQLRRTSSAVSLISPGEFARMAKNSEARNVFSVENARLTSRNSELETVAVLIRKENSLLRRRLTQAICDEVAHEVRDAVAISEDAQTDETGR